MIDDFDVDFEVDDFVDLILLFDDVIEVIEVIDGDELVDVDVIVEVVDGGIDECDNGNGNGDEIVLYVEFDFYEFFVCVSGQFSDEFDDVEVLVICFMDYFVDYVKELED